MPRSIPNWLVSALQASLEPSLTRTAIIVVVGDEILTGKVEDCNSRLLCRELHALGWRVLKASICLFLCLSMVLRQRAVCSQACCSMPA